MPVNFSSQKRRIDALFQAHSLASAAIGVVSIVTPNVFEWFLVHHGQPLKLRDNSRPEQKVSHLLIRLFGALILGTAWIVHSARTAADASMRRALVQAFALCFSLTTAAMLRAQLTETPGIEGGMNGWNWLNIALFAALTALYLNHALFDKVTAYQGLDKALA